MRYRPLPHTVEISSGEGIGSLFIRTANANDMSPQNLARYGLGIGAHTWPAIVHQPHFLEPMSAMFRTPRDLLDQLQIKRRDHKTVSFGDQVLGVEMVDLLKCRMAPTRMNARRAFLRHRWQVRLLQCDPTTGEELVDRCTCGSTFLWATMTSFGSCSTCRLPWHALPSKVANKQKQEQTKFWAGLLSAKLEVRIEARRKLPHELVDSTICDIWRALANGSSRRTVA